MATTWTQVADLSSTTKILVSETLTAILGSAPVVYDPATAYTAGTLVLDNGKLWKALVAVSGEVPGSDPAKWVEHTISAYDDTALQALVATNTADVATAGSAAAAAAADSAAAKAASDQNALDVTANKATADGTQTDLDALTAKVTTNADDLVVANTGIAAVKTTADANTADLVAANTDITAVKTIADKNTVDVGSATTAAAAAKAAADTNTADLVTVNTDLTAVKATADGAEADLVTLKPLVDKNKADVVKVKGDLFTHEVDITEIKDVISDLISEYPTYYDATKTYATNAVVTHNDYLWVALSAGAQTVEPGTDDTVWKKLNLVEMLLAVAPPATGAPPYDDSVLKALTTTNAMSLENLLRNDNSGSPVWNSANAYKAGDVVWDPRSSSDSLFKATSDVGSGGTDPGTDTANWEELPKGLAALLVAFNDGTLGGATGPGALEVLTGVDPQPFDATVAYPDGSYVLHDGKLWKATAAVAVGVTPGVGADWVKLDVDPAAVSAGYDDHVLRADVDRLMVLPYVAATAYSDGQIVSFDDGSGGKMHLIAAGSPPTTSGDPNELQPLLMTTPGWRMVGDPSESAGLVSVLMQLMYPDSPVPVPFDPTARYEVGTVTAMAGALFMATASHAPGGTPPMMDPTGWQTLSHQKDGLIGLLSKFPDMNDRVGVLESATSGATPVLAKGDEVVGTHWAFTGTGMEPALRVVHTDTIGAPSELQVWAISDAGHEERVASVGKHGTKGPMFNLGKAELCHWGGNLTLGHNCATEPTLGGGNVAVGIGVLRLAKNGSGTNTGFGVGALNHVLTANSNVAVGAHALSGAGPKLNSADSYLLVADPDYMYSVSADGATLRPNLSSPVVGADVDQTYTGTNLEVYKYLTPKAVRNCVGVGVNTSVAADDQIQLGANSISVDRVGVGDDRLVPLKEVQSLVAGAADFAAFQVAVAALV